MKKTAVLLTLNSLSVLFNNLKSSRMAHFSSIRDPLTGELGWVLEQDYKRDIARAAYADMLHDEDRNIRYYKAIKSAVASVQASNRKAIVLDIGTGTGLLSMMASRAGADEIYACECFHPMYTTARKVIASNMIPNITLIPKRSTELVIGVDLPQRANILITETFDTELIGEHCIETYNHAGEHLMEKTYISVPTSATVYVQLVNANFKTLNNFHVLRDIFTQQTQACPGLPSAHDLQLSKLKPGVDFEVCTKKPQPLFHFDFTKEISKRRCTTIESDPNYTTALFFWELQMSETDNSVISCFPSFHLDVDNYHWREHWIQWVQYIPPALRKSQLTITQTELNYHFEDSNQPSCTCGFHRVLSRSRIYELNAMDTEFFLSLDTGKTKEVLFLGDNSMLPFYLKDKFDRVGVVGRDCFGFEKQHVTEFVIIAEPHYESSQSCLNNLHFFHQLRKYTPIEYFPKQACVKGIAVKFHHLHKIRSKVGSTCGFDLTPFDELISDCITNVDPLVEYHSLWEYDFDVLEQYELFNVDSGTEVLETDVNLPEHTNGVVFYVDWNFGGKYSSNFDNDSRQFKIAALGVVC